MQNFTNETIDLQRLPKYQETALMAPDSKYWKIIVTNLVIFLLVVGIGLTTLVVIDQEAQSKWLIWTGIFLVFAVLLFLVYRASFKRRGFALREKDIIYKSGIIAETTTIVPLKNIQHIELNEGWMSRLLKLGTIEVFTAGGGTGHLQINGIPIEQAKSLKEALLKQVDLVSESDARV